MRWCYLILAVFSVLLSACEPAVVFDEAQPKDVPSITKIPSDFIGSYRCASDSTIVIVEPHMAYQQIEYKVKMSLEEIEETENCSIVDGGLYISGRHECFPIHYMDDDTVMAYVTEIDTLFSFTNGQILKMYNGVLVINQKIGSGDWMIWTLSINIDGSLNLNYIDIPEEIEDISRYSKSYTKEKINIDYERYVISPTLIEFEKLLENEQFNIECDVLFPINIEIDRAY